MRAALLPAPGNPFLIEHWLRNYERVWAGEVDELRVHVNGQRDPLVRDAIREAVEARDGIYMEGLVPDHGYALYDLINTTEADNVMLCEDDCRVRIEGEVNRRFERLEAGRVDVIGSPRVSMTNKVQARARAVLPNIPNARDARGDQGHGMWPGFVFARRECLLATDQKYGAVEWRDGDEVLGLDWRVDGLPECADTFGSTALQLRARFRVEHDVQHKGPHDWERQLANPPVSWFHIGSLSSWQFNGEYLHAAPATPEDVDQWSHRFAWWRRVWDTTPGAFEPWREQYIAAWDEYRAHIGVPDRLVTRWAPLLDRMVTWNER